MSQKAKVRFLFFVSASFAIALVISLVIGVCFFTALHKKDKATEISRYKLSIGLVDTKKSTMNVYTKNIVRDGIMCVNFSQISEKCGYTMLIDEDEIRFYLNNNDGDMMIVTMGEHRAYLNGVPVYLSVSPYKVGENIYLPIDFITTYFDGITIESDDEAKTITIEYIEPKKCSLKLKGVQNIEPLDKSYSK